MEKALKTISKFQAEKAMKKAGLNDPARGMTPASIASSGHAFELKENGQTGTFVAEKRGPELWIHGAAGDKNMSTTGNIWNVLDKLAGALDCQHVAFQTSRPGLVKIARKHGYKIAAVILEKSVQNGR